MKGRAAKTSPTPATTPAAATGAVSATPATAATRSATPAATAAAAASPAPSVPAAGQQKTQASTGAAAKKPDPQKVQQIKSQHTNFRAQPKPDKVPAVTFNQSRRIEGSDRWQGQQYEVFRSYRPERHDQGWYRSRYSRVELIGGGYYYWNNGYWYPAWGYNPSAEYYAYDGPIYVGHSAEPPDKVIADVQAVLQEMGYYKGEVDGLLGPLTREALTAYQADQGLTTTAAIDQPTLDSLGMG
jgi:Putative peptidoglycan binding domain